MNNSQRFQAFYGNNKNSGNCHGAGKIGDKYVCPTPTIGGTRWTEKSKISKQNAACGVPVANLGRVAYCDQAQVGGRSVEGMIFTATGQLNKKKRSCGCQSGGAHASNSHSAEFNDTSDPSSANHSGDWTGLDFPRNTCKCKSSSHCDYNNGNGTPITGYFPNIAVAPIGNRPVYSAYNNMSINSWTGTPVATSTMPAGNLLDRKFDCQQPFWCEKCF